MVTGLFILIGFLTPIFSLLAAAECVSVAVFGISRSWSLLDSKLIVLQVTAGLIAIAFLGPGAFSFDARLFGWKEIVIPAGAAQAGRVASRGSATISSGFPVSKLVPGRASPPIEVHSPHPCEVAKNYHIP